MWVEILYEVATDCKRIHLHTHSAHNVTHIVRRILSTLCLIKADDLGNLLTIYSQFWSYFLRKMGFFLRENGSMKNHY